MVTNSTNDSLDLEKNDVSCFYATVEVTIPISDDTTIEAAKKFLEDLLVGRSGRFAEGAMVENFLFPRGANDLPRLRVSAWLGPVGWPAEGPEVDTIQEILWR